MMNVRGPRPVPRHPGAGQRMAGPRIPGIRGQGPMRLGAPKTMTGPRMQQMQQMHTSQANVGNVTNDPAGAHCRVFVGNLNTVLMKKEEVESIFSQYGFVSGISMHKGYAFVQYNNTMDARRAVSAEDGKTYAGQTLDINIASEPKNRPAAALKRPAANTQRPTLVAQRSGGQTGPPIKKPRQDGMTNMSMKRTLVTLGGSNNKTMSGNSSASAANKPSNTVTVVKSAVTASQDVLICGVCKTQFKSLHSLAQHKKLPCQLRFSCKCQNAPPEELSEPKDLLCAVCDVKFTSAWSLCQHCQEEHSISIFKTPDQVAATKDEPKEVNGDESV